MNNTRSRSNVAGVTTGDKDKSYGRTDTARTCSSKGCLVNSTSRHQSAFRNQSDRSAGLSHRPSTSGVLTATNLADFVAAAWISTMGDRYCLSVQTYSSRTPDRQLFKTLALAKRAFSRHYGKTGSRTCWTKDKSSTV